VEYFADPVEFEFFDYMNANVDEFKKALFDVIFYASSEDKELLRKVYPEYVQVVENYQNIPGYFKTICVKVANA
jgi:Fe-S oxidoreductase